MLQQSATLQIKPVFDINAVDAPPSQPLLSCLPLTPRRATTPITWLFLVLKQSTQWQQCLDPSLDLLVNKYVELINSFK